MCKSPEEAEISRAINCAVPGVVVSPTVKQENNQNSKYRKKNSFTNKELVWEKTHEKSISFSWIATAYFSGLPFILMSLLKNMF